MSNNESTDLVERAFEAARSGTCADVSTIKKRLKRIGFTVYEIDGHFDSSTLRTQLQTACREATGVATED